MVTMLQQDLTSKNTVRTSCNTSYSGALICKSESTDESSHEALEVTNGCILSCSCCAEWQSQFVCTLTRSDCMRVSHHVVHMRIAYRSVLKSCGSM